MRERRLRRNRRRFWFKPGRTENWWVAMKNEVDLGESWKKNFRMSRPLFANVVQELRAWLSPDPRSPNFRALTPENNVAMTLYYLKYKGSLCMTANAFGIAIPTVSVVITEVCTAICKVLWPKYVQFPKCQEDMRRKFAEFEAKFGMVQCCGCIDGTHVPISRPTEDSQDYYCYKGFYSLNVQAVCDFRGYFMDVDCRWPGNVHDGKVFSNSAINMFLRSDEVSTYATLMPGHQKAPNYLVADPAFPLLPYCMKEFSSCDSNEKVVFNNLLRAARNPIESAFGRLKARWGVLTKPIDLKLCSVPNVIY